MPAISIKPKITLVDEILEIKLSGFMPNQLVTLRAIAKDVFYFTSLRVDLRAKWESFACFLTDLHGEVNLATQKPLWGTYSDKDPMGIFWSMGILNVSPYWPPMFFQQPAFPGATTTTLLAEVNGIPVAEAEIKRYYKSPEVKEEELQEDGLIGKFFYPGSADKSPGIIVLGGAEGGLKSSQYFAAVLASHGYAALALAYFGESNLPATLIEIPLEYFAKAIKWLQKHRQVERDKVGVLGYSKGGELALLLGATFNDLKAVVAYVPSGIVFQGFDEKWPIIKKSTWSYRGKEIPFVTCNPSPLLRLESIYLNSLSNQKEVNQAFIAVENINGPILLISAEDDPIWPSRLFSQMVMQRLARRKFPYAFHHFSYQGAGHLISFPYVPTTLNSYFGGNPMGNNLANKDSWHKVLDFLKKYF